MNIKKLSTALESSNHQIERIHDKIEDVQEAIGQLNEASSTTHELDRKFKELLEVVYHLIQDIDDIQDVFKG